jgi:cobalt-zinc-cadmium efflux system outer membrane protein
MLWFWRSAISAALSVAVASAAAAGNEEHCSGAIARTNLVECALAASLAVRAEQYDVAAGEGRAQAARTFLPSNPVLALSGARRRTVSAGGPTALDWSVTLSQEVEIAGQRGSRRRAAAADVEARRQRVALARREVARQAWTSFFELLSAREEQQLAGRLLEAAQRMSAAARAKADAGLSATLDADVVEAATLRVLEGKLSADRALLTAGAELAFLLGKDPSQPELLVRGELAPLRGLPEVSSTLPEVLAARPELALLDAERRAQSARAQALRRSRVPNPTLSAFAENDGFDERVFGLGLSLPIPLPSPVGQTFAGEIAEAEALAERALVEQKRTRAQLRLDVARAAARYATHRQAVAALPPESLGRAETSLGDLSREIEAGRIAVREALVAEQALIELLQTSVAERKALCLASVEWAAALGLSLEGEGR